MYFRVLGSWKDRRNSSNNQNKHRTQIRNSWLYEMVPVSHSELMVEGVDNLGLPPAKPLSFLVTSFVFPITLWSSSPC